MTINFESIVSAKSFGFNDKFEGRPISRPMRSFEHDFGRCPKLYRYSYGECVPTWCKLINGQCI